MSSPNNPVFTDGTTVKGDGTKAHPLTGSTVSGPGGTDTAVQFNEAGTFGGDAAAFAWDDSTDSLSVQSILGAGGNPNSEHFLLAGTNNENGLDITGDGAGNEVLLQAGETGAVLTLDGDSAINVDCSAGNITVSSSTGILIQNTTTNDIDISNSGGGDVGITTNGGGTVFVAFNSADKLSFFAGGATGQPTITGSRGGNAALASLLTALAAMGLIVDGTSA